MSAATPCYWRGTNIIHAEGSGWVSCQNTQVIAGGAQLCCIVGSSCGEDSICRTNATDVNSGYYVGGCTDPTYRDPVCRSSCTDGAQTWITYDNTNNVWDCCAGTSGCQGNVTGETFAAIAPAQWSAVPSVQTTASTSSPTSTSTATSSATSSASAISASATASSTAAAASSNLSTGAVAGIGVAAAVVGVALIALLVGLIIRKRRKSKGQAVPSSPVQETKSSHDYYNTAQTSNQEPSAPKYGDGGIYFQGQAPASNEYATSVHSPTPVGGTGYKQPPVELSAMGANPQELASTEIPRPELDGDVRPK